MKFVDSIEDFKKHALNDILKKRKILKASEELIALHMDMVDAIRYIIMQMEAQIKVWQDLQTKDLKADFQEEIELFQLIAEFYRVNGRLLMLELDVSTAYKHIFFTKTEYEYRFFARRIYTLMYESNKGLVIPAGQVFKKLVGKVDAESLERYKKEHSKLIKFLKDHEDELKEVRNSNEAHKFKGFEVQLESIEKLSAARSLELIGEFNGYLADLTKAFMFVPGALSRKLGEIVKRKVEKRDTAE